MGKRKTKQQILDSLDTFATAYIECLLWSTNDESNEYGGEPLDANYGPENLTLDALRSIVQDCADFQENNEESLRAAYLAPVTYDRERAGHDFWLTRNGHGAGFWDRGLGKVGDDLTKAAKVYGSIDPGVHRGRIYL